MSRLRRDRATWLIYAQLGIWGYFVYGFGPVVPLLRDEQGTSASLASLHGTGLALGAVVGGTMFPALARRFGRGPVLWAALTGLGLTVIGLCLSRPLPATLLATVAVGICGTLIVNPVVAILTTEHGDAGPAAIAEANAAACGTGVIAPILVGIAVGAGLGWRPGIAVLVALIGLVALVATILRVPGPRPTRAMVPSHVERPGRLPAPYWAAWALMAATGSVEVCLSLWAAQVLRGHAGMDVAGASAAVSAIVVGMFAGRSVGGRLALRFGPIPLFLGVLAISAAGFAIFWTATAAWLAVAGLLILGLGNAMHYPLGISLALRAAPGHEDRAAARASYSAAFAFGFAPFILGAIADGIGAHRAFLLVPVLLAIAAALLIRLSFMIDADLVSACGRSSGRRRAGA